MDPRDVVLQKGAAVFREYERIHLAKTIRCEDVAAKDYPRNHCPCGELWNHAAPVKVIVHPKAAAKQLRIAPWQRYAKLR